MSHDSTHVPLSPDESDIDFEQALNANWEWSDSVTDFITDRIEGYSLKVCTGLRPVADVNLDILPLQDLDGTDTDTPYHVDRASGEVRPEYGAHEAIGGRFVQGDMFDLPFDDKTFDTVISDPPWRDKSEQECRQMFEECLRVCKVGGRIIYNATWLPEAARSRLRDTRFRQQNDFWGNSSFITVFRRLPDEYELVETYDYEVSPDDGVDPEYIPHNRRCVLAKHVDAELETNPYIPDSAEEAYHCPKCGGTRLYHLEAHSQPGPNADTYECNNCGYRLSESLLEAQASQFRKAPVDSLSEWKTYLEARGFDTWSEAHQQVVDVTTVTPTDDTEHSRASVDESAQGQSRSTCVECNTLTDAEVCSYCTQDSAPCVPTSTPTGRSEQSFEARPQTTPSAAD